MSHFNKKQKLSHDNYETINSLFTNDVELTSSHISNNNNTIIEDEENRNESESSNENESSDDDNESSDDDNESSDNESSNNDSSDEDYETEEEEENNEVQEIIYSDYKEYTMERMSGDKKVLNILSSIITNNPDYNFNKVITTFKNELKDIENTLNENYSDFTKDCINIQITCGNDLIKKLKESHKNNNNFDFNKFIRDEKKLIKRKMDDEIIISTINGFFEKELGSDDKNSKSNNSLYERLLSFGSNNKALEKYIKDMNEKDINKYSSLLEDVEQYISRGSEKPDLLNVLDRKITNKNKSVILPMISDYESMNKYDSDKSKYKRWINKILKVPFDNYIESSVSNNSGKRKIKSHLNNIEKKLNSEIYGHKESKHKLLKTIAKNISNPKESGNILALEGSPGVGKTELMNVIAKSLDRPFEFISLGGIQDGAYLDGHGFTYVGSCPGKIVETIIHSKCMNPIIFFDELDKVSNTNKGEEIFNILMHLTDKTQNNHFNDKYFSGIDFDLSQVLFIFTYNYRENIPRPLYDRLEVIKVDNYDITDKLNIAHNHLIPKLLKEYNMEDISIIFNNDVLEHIIYSYTNEGGVRKFKEKLKDIISEINLMRYTENIKSFEITKDFIDNKIFKLKPKMIYKLVDTKPAIGNTNGLWASDSVMIGGTLQIESCFMPSKNILDIECTGSLKDVIKESIIVAKTVAWRILPDIFKDKLLKEWEKNPVKINVHLPEGGTPKDGPSAGGTICLSIISLLTEIKTDNTYAMTGEINLQGQITKIGGLKEKIFGAKQQGISHILCPEENKEDLDIIKEKYPKLFNKNFTVEMISSIYDILDRVLIDKIEYNRI
jgi:endopeptidase La